jgi:hypothetical protein
LYAKTLLPVTDESSYNDQYSVTTGDGVMAKTNNYPMFTASTNNVDLFSQNGKNIKNNNISSTKNLYSGAYNILRKSLEIFGGKDKK